MKRPRRSRGIRRSCIETCHRGLVKRSCRELLFRDLSMGLVKKACRELLYRDLSERSCEEIL